MEARNITIVSTQNQNKYVVNTDATTLAELKSALSAQGIPYSGMTFYEGLSHTELLTDESVLPHDVPYKGAVTNELVFMLTTPNKKIKSGVSLPETRQALYETIEELGLRDACIATYGKNFTQCKNSELMSLIEENQEAVANAQPTSNLEKAFRLLVDVLHTECCICTEDADTLLHVLDGEEVEEPYKGIYSDEELDNMFDFLK